METKCDLCGCELELVAKYGDGWEEPREESYICPNCGCDYIWRQDTGWEYDVNYEREDKEWI